MRLTVSEVAERHLEQWLDQTQRGELQLHELPAPVAAFYFAGWADGMAHAARQAREYEHQLDLAYLQLVHPAERARQLQERLQAHFEAEAERFFAEPDIPAPASHFERRAA